MTIPFTMRVVVPKQVLVRSFEQESVLLNLDSECYHGLDDMGTRMYQTLLESENIQAAYDSLLADFDVDAATLRRDLEEFIQKLVQRGLVELHGN